MNAILRGVRVIDPLARLDTSGQDVWIDGGKILAIYHHIDADGVPVVDLTPTEGEEPCVLCPGFIDLHAHLRQPGDDEAETLELEPGEIVFVRAKLVRRPGVGVGGERTHVTG